MGRESVAAVRALFEACARGDQIGLLAALDPEVEWIERDLAAGDRIHQGRGAVARVLAASRQEPTLFERAREQVLMAGAHVVVVGRSRRSVGGCGVERPFTQVFTVRDGRVARLVTYREPAFEVRVRALGG